MITLKTKRFTATWKKKKVISKSNNIWSIPVGINTKVSCPKHIFSVYKEKQKRATLEPPTIDMMISLWPSRNAWRLNLDNAWFTFSPQIRSAYEFGFKHAEQEKESNGFFFIQWTHLCTIILSCLIHMFVCYKISCRCWKEKVERLALHCIVWGEHSEKKIWALSSTLLNRTHLVPSLSLFKNRTS